MRKSLCLFLFILSFCFQAFAAENIVIIYSTSWCGHCKQAKNYLDSKNIEYTNYDIGTSDIARKKFNALNGRGVPLIYVGNERIEGFHKEALENSLKAHGLLMD